MLKWSQAENGNWNGKAGPYTLMVVAFHTNDFWWLHPKLPGLKGRRVRTSLEGQTVGDHLFSEWLEIVIVATVITRSTP